MDNPIILSMHIEKCGGTSMRTVFQQWLGSDVYSCYKGYPDTLDKCLKLNPPKVIHGHMHMDFHNRLNGLPYVYVTVLRHPITRTLSNYWHRINANDDPFCGDILQFCEMPVHHNRMVYRITDDASGSIDSLEKAKRFLTECKVVGFTERLESFKKQMQSIFGFRETGLIPYANQSTKCRQISVREAQSLASANRLDLELYEWAKATFYEIHVNE